jgi:hypothetical protein
MLTGLPLPPGAGEAGGEVAILPAQQGELV